MLFEWYAIKNISTDKIRPEFIYMPEMIRDWSEKEIQSPQRKLIVFKGRFYTQARLEAA